MAAPGKSVFHGGITEAGLNLKSGLDNGNPIQHGSMGQAERAFSATSTFLSGVMAISASQFIGAPLKYIDPKSYRDYMAWTKESFAVLMTTITQWWAPTVVRVSGDDSMKDQLFQMEDGTLKCNFPHRLVLMSNHSLYLDWLYLWWVAYTNKMHGRIYIIMKESLKQLPILGWAAQFYNFIFLSRKWEEDKSRFKQALNSLKDPNDPMWLLIFPEGTNLSAVTREKSAAWSKKTGIPDMKHQLLPRSTGLQFCLKELRPTTNWLYDATIAYEGVPKGLYGQDIFTLKSSFFEGRPPKSVNIFWRRFKISDIPYQNEEAFSRWLLNRWREKDYILEYFYKFGSFPADDAIKAVAAVEGKRKPRHAKAIATSVQGGGWDEFLSIFGPITSAAGALSAVDMTEPLNFDELMKKVAQSQQLNLSKLGQSPMAAFSQNTVRKALQAANVQNVLPPAVIQSLLKDVPQTQAQMKKTLQQAPDKAIAKRTAKAPGADSALPDLTRNNVNTASQQADDFIKKMQSAPPARSVASPARSVRKEMPLANMESMITRPLSTMAVQNAGTSIRRLMAERSQAKGAALPGQHPPGATKQKTAASGHVKLPDGTVKPLPPTHRAASVIATPSKPPTRIAPKAASVSGVSTDRAVRRPSVATVPSTVGKVKLPGNSKPVGGGQKSVNSKPK